MRAKIILLVACVCAMAQAQSDASVLLYSSAFLAGGGTVTATHVLYTYGRGHFNALGGVDFFTFPGGERTGGLSAGGGVKLPSPRWLRLDASGLWSARLLPWASEPTWLVGANGCHAFGILGACVSYARFQGGLEYMSLKGIFPTGKVTFMPEFGLNPHGVKVVGLAVVRKL